MSPDFTVVLRGYDRVEVDRLLTEFAAGRVAPEELTRTDFTVALRGYDRTQVDLHLARLAAQAADRGPVRREQSFRREPWLFKGYDPTQVDALVVRAASVLAGGGGVTADEIEATTFALVRAGYDREQVDSWRATVVRELRGRGRAAA